jgi:lysophospholipase L1-like esterase
MKATILKTLTLIFAVATLALASLAHAADKLPDFVNKVQLWNCGGAEPTADGRGVMLYRAPKEVRDQLDTKTPDGKERSGATQMRAAAHSEVRFVLNQSVKHADVKLHLKSEKGASLVFFWGDVLAGEVKLLPGDRAKPVPLLGHGLLFSLIDKFPQGRFANGVCRVVIKGADVVFNGIDGDVRPPKPEELAPVMLSYGTSISQGAAASRTDLAWNALTARALGYDFINMGSSGTAFCEPAMADYLASLKWDLCVLELSVNMSGVGFTTEQFKERAGSLIDKLAKTHPKAPIVCISLFPFGTGDLWKNPTPAEYRKALEAICKASPHKNVHFASGPDLLSFAGLSEDLLHPSDHGMIEIATKLAPRIRTILEKKNP